jgi:hypothetical protein
MTPASRAWLSAAADRLTRSTSARDRRLGRLVLELLHAEDVATTRLRWARANAGTSEGEGGWRGCR